ncbi:DUF4198 domain-containing protein [Mucilaginibacter hurinus]|nr:DUF4198 domain-containing protein [Mucilaginibacter hurinus]
MMQMKRVSLLILSALVITFLVAATGNYFLLAQNFFLKKGDMLSVRLFTGLQPGDDAGQEGPPAGAGKFVLYEGSKKIDLAAQATDTVIAIQDYKIVNPGLALLQYTQTAAYNEFDKEEFEKQLNEDGNTDLAKRVAKNRKLRVKEKYTCYLKTLVKVEKNSGNVYEKVLGDPLELVLKTNPYKLNYGDDVTAVLYLKDKPLANEVLMLYIKTATGNVHPQKLVTDAEGRVYFKLSREGIYILRSARTQVSDTKDADFETMWASFTFAFSSANELPNSYKEFGFGDKH